MQTMLFLILGIVLSIVFNVIIRYHSCQAVGTYKATNDLADANKDLESSIAALGKINVEFKLLSK
jgi:hypothetical protein